MARYTKIMASRQYYQENKERYRALREAQPQPADPGQALMTVAAHLAEMNKLKEDADKQSKLLLEIIFHFQQTSKGQHEDGRNFSSTQ